MSTLLDAKRIEELRAANDRSWQRWAERADAVGEAERLRCAGSACSNVALSHAELDALLDAIVAIRELPR